MAWTDVVMVGLTAASVVVAAVAVGHSRRATEAANRAVLRADDANRIAKDANVIATKSNEIAEGAAQHQRDVPIAVAWDGYIVALAALQAFDPTSEKIAEPLNSLRTRATLLVDLLDWEGFGEWLAAEHAALIQRFHEGSNNVIFHAPNRFGRRATPAEMVELLKPAHTRVAGLTQNVRLCRRSGPEAVPFARLAALAREDIRETSARHGWPVPPEALDGLAPLEPDEPA